MPGTQWHIADGWATESEAREHANALRKEHTNAEIKVHKSMRKYGGGHWLVLYAYKDAGAHGTGGVKYGDE